MEIEYDTTIRETFWSPYDQYADRVGEPFIVIGPPRIENPNTEDEIVLFPIRFTRDNQVIEAWGEEIHVHTSCVGCSAPEHG